MLKHGVFWHYKGGKYLFVTTAETHHHTGDLDVVYVSLKYGKYYTRPLTRNFRNESAWSDLIEWPDGVSRPRFTHESEISRVELANLDSMWFNTSED